MFKLGSLTWIGGLLGILIGLVIITLGRSRTSQPMADEGSGGLSTLGGSAAAAAPKSNLDSLEGRAGARQRLALAHLSCNRPKEAAQIIRQISSREERLAAIYICYKRHLETIRAAESFGQPTSADTSADRLQAMKDFIELSDEEEARARCLADLVVFCRYNGVPLAPKDENDMLSGVLTATERIPEVPPTGNWNIGWLWGLLVTCATGAVGLVTSKFIESAIAEYGKTVVQNRMAKHD